ncbi:hypothetical protein C0J52_21965 [Blattella germanica]|nr:hypothetical protein C0J52_21965 [Blattella germanica]
MAATKRETPALDILLSATRKIMLYFWNIEAHSGFITANSIVLNSRTQGYRQQEEENGGLQLFGYFIFCMPIMNYMFVIQRKLYAK